MAVITEPPNQPPGEEHVHHSIGFNSEIALLNNVLFCDCEILCEITKKLNIGIFKIPFNKPAQNYFAGVRTVSLKPYHCFRHCHSVNKYK